MLKQTPSITDPKFLETTNSIGTLSGLQNKTLVWLKVWSKSITFKDIVQPKKRAFKRGTNRFASTSYTIADVFR
jgi:hypothetical protein